MGFYILLFLVPARVILGRMRGGQESATSVAYVLTLMVGAALLGTVVVNYVLKLSIRTIRTTFLLMAAACGGCLLLYGNTYLLCAAFGAAMPLLYTGANALFASLYEGLDVRSALSQGAFMAASLLGSICAMAALRALMNHVEMQWLIAGYGALAVAVAMALPPPAAGESQARTQQEVMSLPAQAGCTNSANRKTETG